MSTGLRRASRLLVVAVLIASVMAMPLRSTAAPLDGYELPDDAVEARFLEIVDGDTFYADVEVNGRWEEQTIRLIGIDTPETTNSYGNHPECYGQEAKRYADSILNAAPHIWLEVDKDPDDNYGRQLRYVWYEDPASGNIFMLNEELVWDGYALAKSYRPNTTRQDTLDAAEEHAIAESKGMWLACDRTVTGDPTLESGEDFPSMDDPTPEESGTIEEDVFCAVFDTYQDAQDFLAAYPQIAEDIDIDGDGIACEDWFPS